MINLSLFILVISTSLAFISPWTSFPKETFWIAGVLLGTMVGPNQSCSRSYMAQIILKTKKMSFLVFMHLLEKPLHF